MIDTFNGALLLKQDLLHRLRDSPQVVRQGFMVVLLVGLIVGGIDGIRETLRYLNPEQDFDRVRNALEESIDQQAMLNQSTEQRMMLGLFRENLDPGIELVKNISMIPTALPRPVTAVIRGVAVMISRPPGYLGGVLIAILFTHIAALWFGGQGKLQQMLGLGALSVAPHALDAVLFVPYLGDMLSFVAWVWGLVVLIVCTSVAHKMEFGRATMAVLFFPIIGILLATLGCCIFFGIMMALAGIAG